MEFKTWWAPWGKADANFVFVVGGAYYTERSSSIRTCSLQPLSRVGVRSEGCATGTCGIVSADGPHGRVSVHNYRLEACARADGD